MWQSHHTQSEIGTRLHIPFNLKLGFLRLQCRSWEGPQSACWQLRKSGLLTWSSLATGWECQVMPICSDEKMPWVKWLMEEVPSILSSAKLGTMPNQTQTHSPLKRTRKSILPSMCKGCCVAVRRLGNLSRWMRWFHSGRDSDLFTSLSPDLVSRWYRTACVIGEKNP